jgi:hypothetical protein
MFVGIVLVDAGLQKETGFHGLVGFIGVHGPQGQLGQAEGQGPSGQDHQTSRHK